MRGFFGLACLAATLSILGVSGSARADRYDRDVDSVRLYGGLGLGFGGDLELPNGRELDLGTSIGGQFGIDFVLLRYFALGAEARISGYDIEGAGWDGRSRFIDVVAKPRLRLPLARGSELYATVPIGLTFPRFADDDTDEKLGWNIGIGGGYTHFLTSNFGLNVEPIFIIHNFDNDVQAKQFHLLLNAVFAI